MRYLLAVWAILAAPLYADDAQELQSVLSAVYDKDWALAKERAMAQPNEIVTDLYLWNWLRAGEGNFDDYTDFLEANPNWPGLEWLQNRGEHKMPLTRSPDQVIEFVAHKGVQSDDGLYKMIYAYQNSGEPEWANFALLTGTKHIEISADVMDKIRALGLSRFNAGLAQAVNYLILQKEYDKLREYQSLENEDYDIIERRLALLDGEDIAPNSSAESFAAMRGKLIAKDFDGARAIILKVSQSGETFENPELWAKDREDLARGAMWLKRFDQAYQIASQHHLRPQEDGYEELEFLSGFIALEFLDDQELALQHFQNFKDEVTSPVSNARAGYWLGRAGDPSGYEYAAQFQSSFYGQLAAETIGLPFDRELIEASVTSDYTDQSFMKSENIHAAKLLLQIGELDLARRFLLHEAESLNEVEIEALGALAMDWDMPQVRLRLAKNLAFEQRVLPDAYFPIPAFFPDEMVVPKALALAITRQESEFYTRARSHVGAMGLMQLMPGTAEAVSKNLGIEYDAAALTARPDYNIALGTAYLKEMLEEFKGKLPLAVLSYNAGPGRGYSWQQELGAFEGDREARVRWLEQIPFDETRNYVQRVLEAHFIYQGKLQGNFDGLAPSDALTQTYPDGVEYPLIEPLPDQMDAPPARLFE